MLDMQECVTFARDTYRKSSLIVTLPKSRKATVFVPTVELPYFCPCFSLALLQLSEDHNQKFIFLRPKTCLFLVNFRGTFADSVFNNIMYPAPDHTYCLFQTIDRNVQVTHLNGRLTHLVLFPPQVSSLVVLLIRSPVRRAALSARVLWSSTIIGTPLGGHVKRPGKSRQ